eukprot:Opistho-1_new@62755
MTPSTAGASNPKPPPPALAAGGCVTHPARNPCHAPAQPLATRAPGHPGRRWLGPDRRRRPARRGRAHRVGRPRGGAAARAGRARDGRARPRRRAGHARPGRLPHPPRLWRPPRQRIRTAPARRQLRSDRARRRRHPLHRGGHPRGRRAGAVRQRLATRPRPHGRGRDHAGGQVGLRPVAGGRGTLPARGPAARPAPATGRAHHLSGRACTATRVRGPRRRLHHRRLRMAARAARAGPGRCGGRLLREHRLLARADAPRVRGRAGAGPAGQAARRTTLRPGRRGAGRLVRRALVRPPGTPGRRRHPRHAAGRQRGRAAARCLLLPARDEAAPHRRAAPGRRAHGGIDRPQPRHLTRPVAAAHGQHGLHAVPAHAAGSRAGDHRARGTRARPARPRHARPRAARRLRGLGSRPPERTRLLVRPQPGAAHRVRRKGTRMNNNIPTTASAFVWTGRVDTEETGPSPRWHQRVQPLGPGARGGVTLMGFAVDEGVRRNGGRPGAAQGPQALRTALASLPVLGEPALFDAGDVVCEADALE